MRTAILILALLAVSPAHGADYTQQSEAVAACQQQDVNDIPGVMYVCMRNKGFLYCGNCPTFGPTMLGDVCGNYYNDYEMPACWYREGDTKPMSMREASARWEQWIKAGGLKNQKAPYAPPKCFEGDGEGCSGNILGPKGTIRLGVLPK